eukprot:332452-Chlamydomonas_euryale.AAC.1
MRRWKLVGAGSDSPAHGPSEAAVAAASAMMRFQHHVPAQEKLMIPLGLMRISYDEVSTSCSSSEEVDDPFGSDADDSLRSPPGVLLCCTPVTKT